MDMVKNEDGTNSYFKSVGCSGCTRILTAEVLANSRREASDIFAADEFFCEHCPLDTTPSKWKFHFASWEDICDSSVTTNQYWEHVDTMQRLDEHDDRVPEDWSHVCPRCKSPAEIAGISAYGESHKCLACNHTFSVS